MQLQLWVENNKSTCLILNTLKTVMVYYLYRYTCLNVILGSCKMDFGHWCFQWMDEWGGLWGGREQEACELSSADFNKEWRGIWFGTIFLHLMFLLSGPRCCQIFMNKLWHTVQGASLVRYTERLPNGHTTVSRAGIPKEGACQSQRVSKV